MNFRKALAAIGGAAILIVGSIVATPATAETTDFDSWIESGDPAPLATTGDLVFYKGASVNFGHKDGTGLQNLKTLASVSGLAYTVRDSTSYAPSYQLGVANPRKGITYARLVWEAYQQPSADSEGAQGLDPNKGAYTKLEAGVWWVGNVFTTEGKKTPFGSGEGSQSKPTTLANLVDYFGFDAQITFFGVKQGTTSESISTVSSLTFDGKNVPLGNSDQTQFMKKDVDDAVTAATTPLREDLTAAQKARDALTAKVTAQESEIANLKAELAQYKGLGAKGTTAAATVALQNAAKVAQAKLVSISGTAKVGKVVTVRFGQVIPATTKTYQWYVGGKSVRGATKASLKLSKSQARKTLTVKVRTAWTDALGKAQSVTVTATKLGVIRIAK